MPKLLFGMAVYDDFDGVYFTIQSLRMFHDYRDIEIAVVDNHPDSPEGKAVKDFLGWIKDVPVHYVPYTTSIGTAGPRNHLFSVGTAPAVLCVDPHVMLAPGSLAKLIEYYDANPGTGDLLSGPILYDDLKNEATHFNDVWGEDGMWGTWDYQPYGNDPFDIPAMGLGLFTCNRSAWLGFNPEFRGFGGEEWYIHEKFRRAGRRTLCLPSLKWLHRFGRPRGIPYPASNEQKAKNYIIGLRELGLSLDRAKAVFLPIIGPYKWENLTGGTSLDALYEVVKASPRDLDQHADWLKSISKGRVTAFVKRKEWNVILAAGRPDSLTVYQMEDDPLLADIHAAIKAEVTEKPRTYTSVIGSDSLSVQIDPCDLLIFDTQHTYSRLMKEFNLHADKATRILVRASGIFGEKAEGVNEPGLLAAIRNWIRDHPEWTVIYHTQTQYGMTLLSRDPADKQELPPLWKQAANAAKASWRAGSNVLVHEGPLKDTEEQDKRLALCLICPAHTNGRCSACGCPLAKKTSWPSEQCPLGKWSRIDESKLSMPDVQPPAEISAPTK